MARNKDMQFFYGEIKNEQKKEKKIYLPKQGLEF